MTDDIQTLRDDIAYLKALAHVGQRGSRTGGVILMAAGLLFGSASLLQWAALERLIPWTPAAASLSWLGATLLFMIALFYTKMRWRSEGSRAGAEGLAWRGVGIGCFFIFAALALATWRTQSPLLIQFSPVIIFVLYGAAWIVAAASTEKVWLHATAWGCFLAALLSAWFVNDPVNWLVYAGGLFLLAFLPGLIFTLKAPQAGG